MAVKFFGQFLVELGAVNREQLLEAVDLQERVNLKFGEMALSMKLITEADIERVHAAQRSEDLRFGDMAVKLGIISDDEMKQVLTKQKNTHLYIGEALVQIGAITAEELPGLLQAFKDDQAQYVTEKVLIPEGFPFPDLCEVTADLTYKMLTRVAGLSYRAGHCAVTGSIATNDVMASIDFTGQFGFTYLLCVSNATRDAMARAILVEEDVSGESIEVLEDSVMEFINIVAGNVAAKAAQLGKSTDLLPPVIVKPEGPGYDIPEGQVGLLFPIYLSDGEHAELVIILKSQH